MTSPKWLTLIGGILLVLGLLTAFVSSKYTEKVMGEARKGVAVLAPSLEDKEKWDEKERLLWQAEFWFYVGLVATCLGVILQTAGSILPLTKS